ncbi:hypothetical protein FSP39_022373 [Pinctada imbricata]|uniref:t-SNARE coiled-coil homology domain-containing protein n=1 Tax=Pinctada imbricata TaxID=66713 RepID=A0AA89BY07_PINIB|nr:hypothetical protein FSP39_022373 [Pinctada imbricata]
MTRDRLLEFQNKRDEYERESMKKKKGKKDKKEEEEEMSFPGFMEEVKRIEGKMEDMKRDVEEIERTQRTLYCMPHVTNEDLKKMESLADRILNASIVIRKDIETLSVSPSRKGEKDDLLTSNAENRVQNLQIDRLQNLLKKTMDEFRTSQANYLEKTKARINKTRAITGADSTTVNTESVFTGGYSAQEMIKARTDLQEIEEREKELTDLEKQIVEVNQLFREMHGLVQDQGERVDNIEKFIETAVEDVKSGKEDLKQAQEKQSQARRKKIICWTIILVVIIIVVAIIVGVIASQS